MLLAIAGINPLRQRLDQSKESNHQHGHQAGRWQNHPYAEEQNTATIAQLRLKPRRFCSNETGMFRKSRRSPPPDEGRKQHLRRRGKAHFGRPRVQPRSPERRKPSTAGERGRREGRVMAHGSEARDQGPLDRLSLAGYGLDPAIGDLTG